jgi:cytochrome c oxidase subunit 3
VSVDVATHDPAHAHHPALQHHFDTLEQQQNASTLGMWMFLLTEVLFFGGLFMAYILYRWMYGASFSAASHELSIAMGAGNTVVLIGSSLTMALAVRAAQTSQRQATVFFLLATLVLGSIFLGVKVIDAALKNGAEIYFSLYFAMTGLHATHMIIGAGVMIPIIIAAWRGKYDAHYYTPVELFGLYWHFVDIVWIFLFPLLYLIH